MHLGTKRSTWIWLGLVVLVLGQIAWTADPARAGAMQGSSLHRFSRGSMVSDAVVLWDQPVASSGRAALSQDLMQAYNYYDAFSADDFTNDEPWVIKTIFVPGNTWSEGCDLTCADTLHWAIYADDSGKPDGDPSGGGNQPAWQVSVPPTDTQVTLSTGIGGRLSDITLDLMTPVSLEPGTWWLVTHADLSYDICGCNYGHRVADTTNGHAAQIINPGGGWGIPTTWTSVQDPTTLGLEEHDLAFRLEAQGVQYVYLPLMVSGP